jgi:hypothetical protein
VSCYRGTLGLAGGVWFKGGPEAAAVLSSLAAASRLTAVRRHEALPLSALCAELYSPALYSTPSILSSTSLGAGRRQGCDECV